MGDMICGDPSSEDLLDYQTLTDLLELLRELISNGFWV